ncbi:MAG: TraR/DksA family transcriptional regulator [Alphaproteobacteria bacterium]|nr:TraR/DksA family transcriptional regulator [Alphaproteobacteria bacterium]
MTEDYPDFDPAAVRDALEARRDAVRALGQVSAESRRPVTLDQQSVGRLSRMDALQGQEMALAQNRRRDAELARIKAALERLEAGDYGYCVVCDEPIGARRLQADPAIPTCVDCAADAGRTG